MGRVRHLDEEKLQRLHAIDTDLWESLIPPYCAWAMGSFDFNFCDVLVRRLEEVFNLGSLDAKAASALAIAELGASHNRWHVMGRLFLLCGPAWTNGSLVGSQSRSAWKEKRTSFAVARHESPRPSRNIIH